MKKTTAAVFLLLFLAGMAMAQQIAFVDTYDNALKAAGEKQQDMVITFHTDW